MLKKKNSILLCTPFDLVSLNLLIEQKYNFFKIASADLTNHDLIEKAAMNSDQIILSTGMHDEKQIINTNNFLIELGVSPIFLHCNSTYPAPYQDLNLQYIQRLKKITNSKYVGYSGHERGFHIPLAAVALGAKFIEKHFTIDREMEGPDHKVSLLPNEFKEMVSRSRDIEISLGSENVPKVISQGEIINKESLSKSIYASNDIKKNNMINSSDLTMKSPATGLDYSYIKKLVGTKALRNKKAGEPFELIDIYKEHNLPKKISVFKKFWNSG